MDEFFHNVLFLMITNVGAISQVKFMQIKHCLNGYALDGSVIHSQYTKSSISCGLLCGNTEQCLSFNLKRLSSNSYLCELNSQFESINCSMLQETTNSRYYHKVSITICMATHSFHFWEV